MNLNKKILLYGSQATMRKALKSWLTQMQFNHIAEVSSLSVAKDTIKAGQFDLFVLDIQENEATLLTLISQIRADDLHKDVPLLLVLAKDSDLLIEAAHLGINDSIHRPVHLDDLQEKVKKAFEYPQRRLDPAKIQTENPRPEKHPETFPSDTNILIVDDMLTMRKLVTRTCKKLGYEKLTTTTDGALALEALKSADPPFDLVISDWNMPNCTGIDLVHRIRLDKELSSTAFLMVTAEQDDEQVEAALNTGVDAFIPKPFKSDDFKEKLQYVYEKRFGKQIY